MSRSDRQMIESLPPLIAAKIAPNEAGCWIWTGAIAGAGTGYAQARVGKERWRVHVFTYTRLVGPVPEGLELDHLCFVTACVNPAHLEPVTHRENIRRYYARATTCKNGHPWNEENTYYRKSTGRRDCRACHRAWKERQRVQV